MNYLRRFLYWLIDARVKLFALLLILILAFFDFAAMKNLFINLQVSDMPLFAGGLIDFETGIPKNLRGYISETNVYPLMMVVLLEGIPYFLGLEVATVFDQTTYKTNTKNFAKIGTVVAAIAMVGAFALVVSMRLFVISLEGGFPTVTGNRGELSPKFIVQFGLLISPILTSLLAFVASLSAFKSESADELEKKIDHLQIRFLNEQSKFYDIMSRNDDERTALWTSLSGNQNGPIPSKFDDYRKECFDRIRAKLIENVIIQYPGQITRFNSEIEGLLESFIKQMSDLKETDVPFEILTITTDDLFKAYDDSVCQHEKTPIDAWNYSVAGEDLERELKKVLDNAIVVAQFKTTEKPYHMEGDF